MLTLVIVSILITWLLCAAVCIGVGSLLLRAFHFSFSPLDALWTGLALIVAFLQVHHFLRPIDSLAVFLLAALALIGLLWNRTLLLQQFNLQTFQPANILLFLLAAIIIAFRAAGPCEHYDTGLYGAQAIRWFSTYPLVPGLGNLLGQLGFNSSIFLFIAALDKGPWRGLAHHLFSGFLIAALFASILPAALRVFRATNVSSIDWFYALLFVPAAILGATGQIAGANTDLPTTVVCLAAAAMLFRALDVVTDEPDANEKRCMNLLIAMLLFCLAVTFKISSIVFAFSGWILACFQLWPLSRRSLSRKSYIAIAVIFSAAIVVPWICRGLILSGYPFFPSTALGISFEWQAPAADAQLQADFARSFARIPELSFDAAWGWEWLRPWFRGLVREREGFLIPLVFALAGCGVGIIQMAREKKNVLPQWLWLLAPSLTGLVFWFVEAPAIRFGEPIFWTVAATLGTLAALQLCGQPIKKRLFILVLLLLTAWAAHPRLLWCSYFRPSISVRTFLRLPEARVVPHRTSSGLTVYVPVETNQCWDAPLPCSSHFSDALRLRGPANMRSGFASKGPVADERSR